MCRVGDDRVRGAARRHLARLDPQNALVILIKALERGSIRERQDAYSILGEMADARAAELLALEMGKLLDQKLAAEAALDLLSAAQKKKGHPLVDLQLAKHAATKPAGDKVAARSECAVGGDPRRGRELFFGRAELQCVNLGMTLVLFGLGLALNELWFLIAVPIAVLAVTKLAIEREEAYLERRFGAPYVAYKSKVRRWI